MEDINEAFRSTSATDLHRQTNPPRIATQLEENSSHGRSPNNTGNPNTGFGLVGYNTIEESKATKGGVDLAALFIFLWQIALIALFGIFVNSPEQEIHTPPTDWTTAYVMFTGILIMMFIGFGYLMTFMKNYAFGAVGFTMLLTALIIQWSLITLGFAENLANFSSMTADYNNAIRVDIYQLMNSLFAVAALLISFGGVIGKVSPLQLLVMALIEIVVYSINVITILVHKYNYNDPGGTISIHIFGAYFGLAVAWMIGKPKTEPTGQTINDVIAFIGTLFLWIYWPSFNGGALTVDSDAQQRSIANTILSLAASTTGAFSVSKILSSEKKFRPVDIQNATLAGGVAIGAVCNLRLSPYIVLCIGFFAGTVSTWGYEYLQPKLLEKLNLHDTCGIHNLHGMPSLIGGIASILIAVYKNNGTTTTDADIYGVNSGRDAAIYQTASVVTTLVAAIVSGLVTGQILVLMGSENKNLDTKKFDDDVFWEGAEEAVEDRISKKENAPINE